MLFFPSLRACFRPERMFSTLSECVLVPPDTPGLALETANSIDCVFTLQQSISAGRVSRTFIYRLPASLNDTRMCVPDSLTCPFYLSCLSLARSLTQIQRSRRAVPYFSRTLRGFCLRRSIKLIQNVFQRPGGVSLARNIK